MDGGTAELAKGWGFVPLEELPGGHCSRVFADETRVLKAPFQGEERSSGFFAAVAMSGSVGPVVYEGDQETGTLLMERAIPGSSLDEAGLPDLETLRIAAEFARQIGRLEWDGAMPIAEFVPTGDPLANRLLGSTTEESYLHGDLHHGNILCHRDGWSVIDPKGLYGDPAYEPAAYLRNCLEKVPHADGVEGVLRTRIEEFAKLLSLNPWRICAWSLVDVRSLSDAKWRHVLYALERLERNLRSN